MARSLGWAWAAMLAGCFSPAPLAGLPCSESGECPPGQTCHGRGGGSAEGSGVCLAGGGDGGVTADAPGVDATGGAAPFGAAELVPLDCIAAGNPCTDARDPWLSPEGDLLLFSFGVNPAGGDWDIYATSREGVDQPWAAAGNIGTGVDAPQSTEVTPHLSENRLALWFARDDPTNPGAPYFDVYVAGRATPGVTFDGPASPVGGVVDTPAGSERSPWLAGDFRTMLLARASSTSPGDSDLYLARLSAGNEQWDTIERIDALSEAGHDERSVFAVPALRRLFFVRDRQIWEAQWVGDDLRQVEWADVHLELDGPDPDKEAKAGVWVSPGGGEIWFSSDRSGAMQLYRAVRAGS